MEKRSRRRSRKISEQEEVSEEPSPPPVKTRRRSSGGRFIQSEEKKGRGSPCTRSKRLKVSFDILENNLTIGGDTESNDSHCTLTLASKTDNITNRASSRLVGNGAGYKDIMGVAKKQVEIRFKNKDFTVRLL